MRPRSVRAFAFHDIVHAAGGSALSAATNLAYPVGDLLLLSLVIGGTVLLSGRGTTPWFLLAAGICLNVFGDTFNLFQNGILASTFGSDFNAIAWPASIVLMSMSVWLKPRTLDPMREQRTAGFMLPSRRRRGRTGDPGDRLGAPGPPRRPRPRDRHGGRRRRSASRSRRATCAW